jgi:uncharacterized YccA/Bax inhibitor family protein
MRTSNPAFREAVFRQASQDLAQASGTMTVQGTAIKSLVLVGILMVTAVFTWTKTLAPESAPEVARGVSQVPLNGAAWPFVMGGALVGFILGLITSFVPRVSPFTAPLYAAAQGLFLGGFSALFESRYSGIVFQAVGLTIGTLILLLSVYGTGLVRVTEGFKAGVIAATGGICLVYLASWILHLFGVAIPYIHSSGPIGIGFSVFVVVIASLNLVLDFDLIATNARHGAPKYMEWYCGFGLLVTLIWLYLEVLRLLAKLSDRR